MFRRAVPYRAGAVALLLLLTACVGPRPDAPRGFAFRVPPETTLNLKLGEVLNLQEQADRLSKVPLLFLGEHHAEPRSHAAQLELLKTLQSRGRLITVALEMFPPGADDALAEWRLGRVEEGEFLERSRWYEHWGHPWHYYRDLFLWFREQQIPLRGVNADAEMRAAARNGDLSALPADAREVIGDLNGVLEPHRDLLLEQLRGGGHGGTLDAESPQFKPYLRVQTLWNRVMGRRAARLAETQPPNGIVVLLIGSGHLAYKLGANLQAVQVSNVPQISLWDTVVPKSTLDAQGRGHIPVGVSDWARLYVQDSEPRRYPSLGGLKLSPAPAGVRVDARSPFAEPWLAPLLAGDVIRTVNGVLAGTPTRLRLACEALPWNTPADVVLERNGAEVTVQLVPAAP